MVLQHQARNLGAGFKRIDADHRFQARLMEALESAVKRGQSAELGRGLLRDLEEHARAHFQTEMFLMRDNGYPQLAEHLREHEGLLRQLTELRASAVNGKRTIAAEAVEEIRRGWGEHVARMDRELEDFLRDRVDGGAEEE